MFTKFKGQIGQVSLLSADPAARAVELAFLKRLSQFLDLDHDPGQLMDLATEGKFQEVFPELEEDDSPVQLVPYESLEPFDYDAWLKKQPPLPDTEVMRLEDAVAFFNAGLLRDRLALVNRGKLLAEIAKRLETDKSLGDILEFALQALESEENAYQWLVQDLMLLKGRSPAQAILDGDGAHVKQLLANIAYGLPP